MRIIDWNIKYNSRNEEKISFIKQFINYDTIVVLQEVSEEFYSSIKEKFKDEFDFRYSLDYRKPGKYDTKARKLGILIIFSKEMELIECKVLDRSPLPDRTLFVRLKKDNKEYKILGLHSITGCGYYKMKSIQFLSFTEFIDEYKPDFVCIDANEPDVDHYNIKKMDFFKNGPKGAKIFFDYFDDNGYVDSYASKYNKDNFEINKPLTPSVNVFGRGLMRYDFVFVKNNFKVNNCEYHYEEALKVGSDHSIIVCDIESI